MSDWKFSEIEYVRPDFEALKKALADYTARVKAAGSAEEVFAIMAEEEKEYGHFYTMITIAMIRHTIDTRDEFYEKENAACDQAWPEIQGYLVAYSQALADSPFRGDIEAKYGKQLFVQMDLQKKSFCEANIPLMQRESELSDEYQKIMATCAIEFDGKTLNLYGIQKYFEDDDREKRKAAFKAYSDFYHDHEERLEEIWAELIENRNRQGRNLGFENFIPVAYMQQGRSDYGPEEVASFREQVRTTLVPLCVKLYEAQAKRLGLEEIYVFDEKRIFPDGNATPIGDEATLMEEARKMYHAISPETGEFIDFMMEHQLTDLANTPGKASTGYMTELTDYDAPFVFSCFNGTIGDIGVLTHEMGHAFAGYMAMRHQPILDYHSESTDIAEIHSMSMEQFAYPYAEQFFGDQADKYRFQHLQEALTFVPFGVAVDEFQHICYSRPELTPKERTYEWHKLEEKYMPWRKYIPDGFMERGGMWYHKLHIYRYPFYYINYTLTTMGAMEFKTKDAQDHDKTWQDYLTLCKVGGSLSYLETLKAAHLAVPFEAGTVEKSCAYAKSILMAEIEKM